MARGFQKLVYKSIGKEFFTYLVFFVIVAGLITLLYFFIFKLKIKSISQYAFLIFCAGFYLYFTIQLSDAPEEAIHIIEYGLLSFFVFKALSHRIKDWTVYITAAFIVMILGTADEFLQWMMPARYWDYRDVGINLLTGSIFLISIWKGIKPTVISGPVRNYSIRVLVTAITINLILMGFCLSNTPHNVRRYTSSIGFLSWLQQEEAMTEYGHIHFDPEIGFFNSRFELDDITNLDKTNGSVYGEKISIDIDSGLSNDEISNKYKPDLNPFLFEFLLHYYRVVDKTNEFYDSTDMYYKSEFANTVLKESLIIKKYFTNTFHNSGMQLHQTDTGMIEKAALNWNESYVSYTGRMITLFDLNTARAATLILLLIVWIGGESWKRKISDG